MALSHAEEKIDQHESRVIITGNTAEGKVVKLDASYKMYFHPSVKLVHLDSEGNVKKGNWRINKEGDLCIALDSEDCHIIKKRDDGGFNLHSQHGDLILTIDKVTFGNPDKMAP